LIAPRLAPSDRRARGVTLLEILLVLSLLVTMAAISWPLLERPLAHQRLRKAADRVRTEWARARIEAMSTGQTLVFRYALGDRPFSIDRLMGPEYSAEASAVETAPSAGLQAGASYSLTGSEPELPENVTFFSGEVGEDARGASLESSAAMGGEAGWGDPIYFYPDGTTSTARLVLANEHGDRVELSLRGLTGVATVGETYSDGE